MLSRPPPNEDQERYLDDVWKCFPTLVVDENLVWKGFPMRDLFMIKSLCWEEDSFIPSTKIYKYYPATPEHGQAEVPERDAYTILEDWNELKDPREPEFVRALQYCLFRVYLYSCVFHAYKAGRERSEWIWDENGDLVNPPIELIPIRPIETEYEKARQRMKECLYRKNTLGETVDEFGKPIVCSEDRLFPEPWNLKGEELDDYIDWAAPKQRVRERRSGEKPEEYARKLQAYEQGYTAWRRMIKQNPAGLKEWPIGGTKMEWLETSPGKKEFKPIVNIFLTYGIVELHPMSSWESFWYTVFNPVESIYGKTLFELIFQMADQVMNLILEVFKVVVDETTEAVGNLLDKLGTPLMFAVATAGGMILYNSIKNDK